MHLLPLDRTCPPLGHLQRLHKNHTLHERSSLQLTVGLHVDMGIARNRQGIDRDPWAVETHCGSCMRCLIVACSVQRQPGGVSRAIQLPLLVVRSMTAHLCLAAALCLVAACSALDRHRPHPQPSPSGDNCPVCTGAENVPHPGQFEYFILDKYVSRSTPGHNPQA